MNLVLRFYWTHLKSNTNLYWGLIFLDLIGLDLDLGLSPKNYTPSNLLKKGHLLFDTIHLLLLTCSLFLNYKLKHTEAKFCLIRLNVKIINIHFL